MPPAAEPRLQCGNPILLGFLEKWQEECRGTDRERVYRKAAESMRICPTTFSHPSEATCLMGVGPKIAERLTKCYKEYKESRGETPPAPPIQAPKSKSRKRKSDSLEDAGDEANSIAGPSEDPTSATGALAATLNATETLFDSGEPRLGFYDRVGPKKKKKAAKKAAPGDGEEEEDDAEEPASKARKPRAPRAYVPRLRTGGYAILMALAELPEGHKVSKDELIRRAQPYCDSSFSLAGNPGEGRGYTAWGSVKTLKEHSLLTQQGRPALFSLTEHGWDTVEKMVEVENALASGKTKATKSKRKNKKNDSDDDEAGDQNGNEALNPDDEEMDAVDALPAVKTARNIQLPPRNRMRSASAQPADGNEMPDIRTPFTPRYLKAGTFKVQLILDNREVASKTDRDYIQRSFENINCNPITRGMELGDVMWIASGKLYENGMETGEEIELSLDYVCERKRIDDLVGSIKDGRFHEQKFRLKKLISNVTYIIELPHGKIQAQTASLTDAITTAIYSTQVVNGFFVKLSPKLDDTVRYLARYTKILKEMYEGKDLYVYPDNLVQARTFHDLKKHLDQTQPRREYFLSYNTLAAMASKSRANTLRDVFLKMLMCTKGVSAEKALEIQRHFKTPKEFLEAFKDCESTEDGKKLVMNAVDPNAKTDRRKVKAALSAKVWEVWGQ